MWAETLRGAAVVGVIVMHVSYHFSDRSLQEISSFNWYLTALFPCLGSFCVPVFYMITGAFMLEKPTEPYKDFFQKRFLKVGLPLVFWVLAYGLFNMYYFNLSFNLFEWWLNSLSKGEGSYHLWFMYDILGIYLTIPIYRRYVQSASAQDLQYFLITWYCLVNILPVLKLHYNFGIGIHLEYWTQQIGFVILGYYIKNHVKQQRPSTMVWLYLLIAGFQAFLYYYGLKNYGSRGYFEIDIAALQPLKSAAVFLAAIAFYHQFPQLTGKFDKLVSELGSTAFGVYLLHGMVLAVVDSNPWGLVITDKQVGVVPYILLNSLIVYAISLIITYALKKNPVLKYIIP